jgi:hypothetical protein
VPLSIWQEALCDAAPSLCVAHYVQLTCSIPAHAPPSNAEPPRAAAEGVVCYSHLLQRCRIVEADAVEMVRPLAQRDPKSRRCATPPRVPYSTVEHPALCCVGQLCSRKTASGHRFTAFRRSVETHRGTPSTLRCVPTLVHSLQVVAVRDEPLQAARAALRAADATLCGEESHVRLCGAHGRAAALDEAHKLGLVVRFAASAVCVCVCVCARACMHERCAQALHALVQPPTCTRERMHAWVRSRTILHTRTHACADGHTYRPHKTHACERSRTHASTERE